MRPHVSTSSQKKNPFASIQSCDLLDKAMQSKDFPPGEPDTIGSENGCQTNKPQVASYRLDLVAGKSLKDFGSDPSNLHDGTVNGRESVQKRGGLDTEGACDIAMKVPPKSLAIAGITRTNGSTAKACDLATDLAKKIEPMLPGGK